MVITYLCIFIVSSVCCQCGSTRLVETKPPIWSHLNQISMTEKMSNPFTPNHPNTDVIDISAIGRSQIFTVYQWRNFVILSIEDDGVDSKVLFWNNRTRQVISKRDIQMRLAVAVFELRYRGSWKSTNLPSSSLPTTMSSPERMENSTARRLGDDSQSLNNTFRLPLITSPWSFSYLRVAIGWWRSTVTSTTWAWRGLDIMKQRNEMRKS